MDTFLVIAQGAGLATACGVRPFLPVVLAGVLASRDTGLNFTGTDFAFLEHPAFLAAVLVLLIAVVMVERRRNSGPLQDGPLGAALAGVAIGVGALLFAGSLADEGHAWWPGLVGGLACAAIAQAATRGIFAGAAARLDEGARKALPAYADMASLVIGVAAILLPPLALVALVALAVLALRSRGRSDRKYAGLRVLR